MKISGFSFTKNADTLYYPVVESIKSILFYSLSKIISSAKL